MKYREIEREEELLRLIRDNREIVSCAFQNLDFVKVEEEARQTVFTDCIFLGCRIPDSLFRQISDCSLIFPEISMPFNPYLHTLYTRETLFGGYRPGDPDLALRP